MTNSATGGGIAWIDTLARVSDLSDSTHDDNDAPALYPVLQLRSDLVFPRMVAPLMVGREASLIAIEVAMDQDHVLVAIGQRDPSDDEPSLEDFYQVGTEVKILRQLRMPDGSTSILVQGRERVKILQLVDEGPFLSAVVETIREPSIGSDSTGGAEPLMRAALKMFERCVALSPALGDEAYVAALNASDPGWLADLIASTLTADLAARQEILEVFDPLERLQRVTVLLGRELDLLELEGQIQARVQEELDKSQREYFLREQLRAIRRELGETDEQGREVADLRHKLQLANLPPVARAKAEDELRRLAVMPPFAPEISMVRTYLDWLIDLPWSQATEDNMDLRHAAQVLAENHFGLPEAKDRILEHIAVRKLARDKMRTPILCLVGPPGTGKTSMGRSVAQALGRKFVRVSVGGVRDEAEIRGHRRTYVGSMPGRIIQAMRTAGTMNPVVMLDEVDKLGQDVRGDPSAALLEVLDPEQNHEFFDHYLDVAYDLSQVFFVTTANLLDYIPSPLVDRMEVIRFPGYLEEEKLEIARQFLVPRQLEQTGLTNHRLAFPDATLKTIIREYTYEAGLRHFERQLAKICRKVARRVAEGGDAPVRITAARLPKYLGPPDYEFGLQEGGDSIGVATGLAWTEAGGDLVHVEVTLMVGKGNLLLTGQLGEIMQESGQAALSFARSHAQELGIDPEEFDDLDIHIHLPEGAIPKDGPSAGITMATALISALTGRAVRRDVAMTGEITLRGRVLAVGGLKEKIIAAHRAGIKIVLFPKKNEKSLVELPARARRGLELVPVEDMNDVLARVLLPASADEEVPRARRRRPRSADETAGEEDS
ncbi:MAG: endopeptidase La [Anaerolineae bacterium]|nr:endopeptidase La [Anaerolineae bacterium]